MSTTCDQTTTTVRGLATPTAQNLDTTTVRPRATPGPGARHAATAAAALRSAPAGAPVAPAAGTAAAPATTAPRNVPGRAAHRTGPPGRRDSRRPGVRPRVRGTTRASAPHWFAEQLLQVLGGRRPVHALLGHVRGAAYDHLAALAEHRPLLPGGADRRTAVLSSVHGSRIGVDVIEACARITTGSRHRALAFRLEAGPDRRWRCTAVQLG